MYTKKSTLARSGLILVRITIIISKTWSNMSVNNVRTLPGNMVFVILPYQRTPMGNLYISPIYPYSSWVFMAYYPQESLFKTPYNSTMVVHVRERGTPVRNASPKKRIEIEPMSKVSKGWKISHPKHNQKSIQMVVIYPFFSHKI